MTAETSINTAWYHVAEGGEIAVKGLKIRYEDVAPTTGASEHRWFKMRFRLESICG